MLALLSTFLISIALSSTCTAHVLLRRPTVHILNQQPLQNRIQEPLADLTTTLHTTVTSYVVYSTMTATLTRYVADETTAIPAAVQTWYGAQHADGCDRTACASCRMWYQCEGFVADW
jgi:hypothetical protein